MLKQLVRQCHVMTTISDMLCTVNNAQTIHYIYGIVHSIKHVNGTMLYYVANSKSVSALSTVISRFRHISLKTVSLQTRH